MGWGWVSFDASLEEGPSPAGAVGRTLLASGLVGQCKLPHPMGLPGTAMRLSKTSTGRVREQRQKPVFCDLAIGVVPVATGKPPALQTRAL